MGGARRDYGWIEVVVVVCGYCRVPDEWTVG